MNKKHHILSPVVALTLDCAMKDGSIKNFSLQKISFNKNLEVFDIDFVKPFENSISMHLKPIPDAINFAIASSEVQINISGIMYRNSMGTLKFAPYKGVNGMDVFFALNKSLKHLHQVQFDSINDVISMVML